MLFGQVQNVVKTLYNEYRIVAAYISAEPELLSMQALYEFAWKPFFTAADTILHILSLFCQDREKSSKEEPNKVRILHHLMLSCMLHNW